MNRNHAVPEPFVTQRTHSRFRNLDPTFFQIDDVAFGVVHGAATDRFDHLGVPHALATPTQCFFKVGLQITECHEGGQEVKHFDRVDCCGMRSEQSESGSEQQRMIRTRAQVNAEQDVENARPH